MSIGAWKPSLRRTYSQGYAAYASEASTSGKADSSSQVKPALQLGAHEAFGLFKPVHLREKFDLTALKKGEFDIMELISVDSDHLDSIPTSCEQFVDPEIAGGTGFWEEVGSPNGLASKSSGAESISPKDDDATRPATLQNCTTANLKPGFEGLLEENNQSTVLLPWDN